MAIRQCIDVNRQSRFAAHGSEVNPFCSGNGMRRPANAPCSALACAKLNVSPLVDRESKFADRLASQLHDGSCIHRIGFKRKPRCYTERMGAQWQCLLVVMNPHRIAIQPERPITATPHPGCVAGARSNCISLTAYGLQCCVTGLLKLPTENRILAILCAHPSRHQQSGGSNQQSSARQIGFCIPVQFLPLLPSRLTESPCPCPDIQPFTSLRCNCSNV